MEEDYIYWKHTLPVGIRVEEVSGCGRNEKIWREIARQIYCEHGETDYRDICHFENGAPYISSSTSRISISHSGFLFAVASLPRTPEADLSVFNVRTALGIDVEKADRSQVLKVRDKYLSDREKSVIGDAENVAAHVLVWTCKEALYKAAMTPVDWRDGAVILALPDIESGKVGKAELRFADGRREEMELYSYDSDGYIVSLAYSPGCAKFKKS